MVNNLPRRPEARTSVATTTCSGKHEEERIFEHHLKKTKQSGVISSDAGTSGGEASGKDPGRAREGNETGRCPAVPAWFPGIVRSSHA